MAGLSEVRASTQDNTSGTQVAVSTNELDGTGALQATVPHGNKTTFSETSRTSITANDTGTTDLTTGGFGSAGLVDLGNCLSVALRATCDTVSSTLNGYLIFYDGSSNPIAISEPVIFTSSATLTIAGSGVKYPSQRVIVDAGAARQCKFYVTAITGTTWNVYVRPI